MGHPAEKPRPRATYAEYAAVPANKMAMIVNGVLYVMSRPAPPHLHAALSLSVEIGGPFARGKGPGGWIILEEPELQLVHEEPINPDFAGWRKERMPRLPKTAYFELAPDWICEILSKSTERVDREEKMPIYADHGVKHAWLVDPIARTVEVYVLGRGRRWGTPTIYRDAAVARISPFEAIDFDLSTLWTEEE